MNFKSSLFCLVLLAAVEGHSFELSDHERILQTAIEEVNSCLQKKISPQSAHELWIADRGEDLNVFRKDLIYSHFYNPNKTLKMFRFDSLVRVRRLQTKIIQRLTEVDLSDRELTDALGHAIHHIQDMAAPPHVVPVMHGPFDGFEGFSFEGEISSGLTCEELAASVQGQDLEKILNSTAEQTLQDVKSTEIVLLRAPRYSLAEPEVVVTKTTAFWQESKDSSFGSYGFLGNHFGDDSFEMDGQLYHVQDDHFYQLFKQKRLKHAVRSSMLALFWFYTSK